MTSKKLFSMMVIMVSLIGAGAFFHPATSFAVQPGLQEAADTVANKGLVPCDGVAGQKIPVYNERGEKIRERDSIPCNYGTLVDGVNTLIKYFLYLATFIAVAMLAYAGLQYFMAAGNPSKTTDAKKMIQTVIVGILIVYSGWLIVYIILDKLLLNDKIVNPLK